MHRGRLASCGALFLLLGACANARGARAGDEDGAATAEPSSKGLAPVAERPVSLADAIRSAASMAPRFVAIAAADSEDDEEAYDVALLDRGRIQQVSVDARTGDVEAVLHRPVLAGRESFAERIERRLPRARYDLARAVEVALAQTPGGRAVAVEVQPEGDDLVYEVRILARAARWLVVLDLASGDLLRIEER